MAGWLSDEWVDATGAVLAGAGVFGDAAGLVSVELVGAGPSAFWRRWSGGAAVDGGVGKPLEAPDLALGVPADALPALWSGAWSPSVAFMRGQLKTAGDNGLLLALLGGFARLDVESVGAPVRSLHR